MEMANEQQQQQQAGVPVQKAKLDAEVSITCHNMSRHSLIICIVIS